MLSVYKTFTLRYNKVVFIYKSPVKWGIQIVGMIFQTRSKTILILKLKDKSYNSFFGLRRNTETSQLLFTHYYPETYKLKFHCRRQTGMNFGYVTENGVNSNDLSDTRSKAGKLFLPVKIRLSICYHLHDNIYK